MILADAILALIVALVFTALLGALFKRKATGRTFWLTAAAMFLFVWAAGIWATPAGPITWGIYWIPFVVAGLVMMLIFAAFMPGWGRAELGTGGFGSYGWVLMILLALVIVAGYAASPRMTETPGYTLTEPQPTQTAPMNP
jgi:hypothetical protein